MAVLKHRQRLDELMDLEGGWRQLRDLQKKIDSRGLYVGGREKKKQETATEKRTMETWPYRSP